MGKYHRGRHDAAQFGQQPAHLPRGTCRSRAVAGRRAGAPFGRLSRLEAQYAVTRERCVRGVVQTPVRTRAGGACHPRGAGMRPLHGEVPRYGYGRLRSDAPRGPRAGRAARPGFARPLLGCPAGCPQKYLAQCPD